MQFREEWRRSRIRGEKVDLNHNKHGSDEMSRISFLSEEHNLWQRSERISVFSTSQNLQLSLCFEIKIGMVQPVGSRRY